MLSLDALSKGSKLLRHQSSSPWISRRGGRDSGVPSANLYKNCDLKTYRDSITLTLLSSQIPESLHQVSIEQYSPVQPVINGDVFMLHSNPR